MPRARAAVMIILTVLILVGMVYLTHRYPWLVDNTPP